MSNPLQRADERADRTVAAYRAMSAPTVKDRQRAMVDAADRDKILGALASLATPAPVSPRVAALVPMMSASLTDRIRAAEGDAAADRAHRGALAAAADGVSALAAYWIAR